MSKKIISVISIIAILFSLFSCAKKTKPALNIKHESVKSIHFKRADFNSSPKNYYMKTVDGKEDIETLLNWVESLEIEKHAPIEVPIENVQYVMLLKGIKDHKLVFMDQYVVYDTTAFTYKDQKDAQQISEKYNLLNYAETQIEKLGLI